MTATCRGKFTRHLTLLVERGVVFTVGVLEGVRPGMRNIPDAA